MSKVVLVTGASSGIGECTANHLTRLGHIVYGVSRNPENITKKLSFTLLKMDVSKNDQIQNIVNYIIEAEGRIDVLINNAGLGMTGPIEHSNTSDIEHLFRVNVIGPINVIQAVLPQMKKQKKGQIINITSIAGYMGLPYRGIYSASKSALETLTEALRMETKDFKISISSLAPGDYDTDIASRRLHVNQDETTSYQNAYATVHKKINSHVLKGRNPIEVAKKVATIMHSNNPAIHYRVGAKSQKISVFLKRILPEKWFERLIINHYNI